MTQKHTLIYTLIIIIAFLLFVNILFESPAGEKNSDEPNEVSVKETEQFFFSTLKDFGINDEWIKEKKISKVKFDSVSYKYVVSIPQEVPIPLILKDLVRNIKNSNLVLNSAEKKNDGTTSLQIKFTDWTKLYADLKYDNNLHREYSKIAFVIKDFADSDELTRNLVFQIQIPTGIVLPLSNQSRELAETIKNNKRDYFIVIDDKENDLDIELSEDTGIDNFDAGIKKVISLFNSPKIFFVNEQDSEFSKNTLDFMKKKFSSRERKIISISTLKELKGEDDYDLHSLVDFHLNGLESGDEKIFLINLESWLSIQPEINKYLKKGSKIVFPSSLL